MSVYITDLQITSDNLYQYHYDSNGRLDYIRVNDVTRINYIYDNNGNLLTITRTTQ